MATVERDTPTIVSLSETAAVKIKELMAAAGYQVIIYPKTGDKEADPLIALLDFFAIRPDQALAGRVTIVTA